MPAAAAERGSGSALPQDPFVASVEELARAILRLDPEGACALPLLSEDARRALLEAARAVPLRRARPVIGEGDRAVRQDFDICMPLPAGGPLHALADALEGRLDEALARLDPAPLARPFALNDRVLQRYPPGSKGISAHRDHVRYRGLVVILQLSGDGDFHVAETRAGRGARLVPARPGSAILMRAPGFAGRNERPFHFLDRIAAERYSFGLRCDARADAAASHTRPGAEPVASPFCRSLERDFSRR